MNEDQDDASPENANDRALLNYLDDILGAPPGRSKKTPRQPPRRDSISPPANVTPLVSVRVRNIMDYATPAAKPERRQGVTLPFPTLETAEKPKVLPTLNLLNLKVAPAPKPAPVPTLVPAPPPVPEPISPAPEAEQKAEPAPQPLPSAQPPWARERFECLIFKVAGLKLAVPLVCLGAIHQIDRKFNALPHQSEWFIGILQTPSAGNIKVLDTALCVMPERYDVASRESLAYVITIHGYRWGLACHELEKSITLEPHQVKWRTERGKRPWLAGTVIDHMCALIDTDGFHGMIEQAEQHR